MLGQRGGGRTGRFGDKVRDLLHDKGSCGLGVGQRSFILLCVVPRIASCAAGEGHTPIGSGQPPGVGVIFQCALLGVGQIHKAGFQQAQHASAGHATQQVQRRVDGPGRGGVLGACSFVAEKRDILQPELVPQGGQILVRIAADDRHAAVRRALPGAGGDLGSHGLSLGLAGCRRVVGDGRVRGVNGDVRRVGRIGQQQVQLGQGRGVGVAAVVGQHNGVCRDGGIRSHTF